MGRHRIQCFNSTDPLVSPKLAPAKEAGLLRWLATAILGLHPGVLMRAEKSWDASLGLAKNVNQCLTLRPKMVEGMDVLVLLTVLLLPSELLPADTPAGLF